MTITADSPDRAAHIVARLFQLAQTRPHDLALTTVNAEGERAFTYAELADAVRTLAARLQQRHAPGARVLLLLDNDHHYVIAFFACLAAGLIAVPLHRPESMRQQHLQRLAGIADDAGATCWLVTAAVRDALQAAAAPLAGQATMLAVDAPQAGEGVFREHAIAPADVAFLQYTSGSTSRPKGVMVTHANLMANEAAIEERLGVRSDDVFVSWLPLYHDMGLIGGLLQPLYRGIPVVLMSPAFFLERPMRWLEAIARHRGTISGGPDFAYRLCVDRIRGERAAGLDLSSWRVAFSGAEPVRHDTLQEFIDSFGKIGFAADAVYPCYGLAESTLLVTGGQRGRGMQVTAFDAEGLRQGRADAIEAIDTIDVIDAAPQAVHLVACGISPTGHALRIADPATGAALADGQVGEIWAAGPSIAAGYWRRPDDSAHAFVELDGQRWLRTGDLGFCRAGALFVTGRSKDMIIVRGQNVYPQDIERAIESEVELARKGRVAAFAIPRQWHPQGVEGIGVALEISRGVQKMVAPQQLVEALQECIVQTCNEAASVIVLLNPGALPKTSSGKLQRSACRDGWRTQSLDAYAIQAFGRLQGGAGQTPAVSPAAAGDSPDTAALRTLWERVMHTPALAGQSHFFRQGGNSLKAVQLAAAIGEHWQIDFPVRLIFEYPQLEQLAQQLQTVRQNAPRQAPAVIAALTETQRQAGLPLSPAQHSLWTTWQLAPDSPAYNMPGILHLQGALDVAALRRSLDDLVARHAILRTVYRVQSDGMPVQLALPARPGILEVLGDMSVDATQARAWLEQRARLAFALAQEIPLRACLVRIDEQRHALGITLHHIAADGQSLPVLLQDLCALYASHSQGQPLPAAPELQFSDYTVWRQQQLDSAEIARQFDYWRTQLGSEHEALPLPDGRRQTCSEEGLPEARHAFTLPADITRALRELCAAQGCSLYMGMLALLDLVLYRATGCSDLRVGAPMAERSHPQTRAMIAYLLNLQVLRTRLDSRLGFDALLRQVRETVLAARQHQDVSFDMVVQALQPERQPHVHPLCQVKCTEREALPVWQAGALSLQLEELSGGEAHFDLSLDFSLEGEELRCLFAYASTRWTQEEIGQMAVALGGFAAQVCAAPALPLGRLSWPAAPAPLLAPPAECAAIDSQGDVIALWLAHAGRAPQALAVADERVSLNAQQLRAQVEQLARRMRALGVRAEDRVAIASGRQAEFVVAVLACLRAGACYVPLDPQLPDERLAYQLADSGACLLLATPEAARLRSLPGAPAQYLAIPSATVSAEEPTTLQEDWPAAHPQQAAYLIYTSGSTGRPKGVAVSRGALGNYVQALLARLALPPGVRSMAMASTVAADLGHTTFFGALCSGRALQLLPAEAAFDPAQFAAFMQERAVDVLKIVPSHLQALLQSAQAAQILPRHTLVVGGESTSPALLQHICALRPDCRVVNHYGPTETTVGVLTQLLGADQPLPLPLGQPLAQLSLQVLDADLNPVPRGAAGELYIGGAGLARGYHGKPGATAERFIADPAGRGARLYRSGDKVRLDRAGRLVFLGRIDDQVKIRGYRVEPQEIGAVLRTQAGVSAAEVLAVPGPEERLQLCAYVVGSADPAVLRSALAARLPDYMVPAHFVALAQLPLTANGKIDRKALPLPQEGSQGSAELPRQDSPQEGAESVIAAIWEEVLGVAQVSRHDNFFALGGDSILTLKIVARLRKAGWRITPRQLMQTQDLAAAAALAVPLEAQGSAPAAALAAAAEGPRPLPLTPIQQWFFQHHAQPPAHWNQSVQLEGPADTPVDRLRHAVDQLGHLHEALRLRFRRSDAGAWQQTVAPHAGECFEAQQVADAAAQQAAIARAQRSLDLSQGPLWRALWLTRPRQSHGMLVLIAHHLVVDGVSWRILLEDLLNLLQGAALHESSSGFGAWASAVAAARLSTAEQAHWQALASTGDEDLPCTPAHSVGKRADNTIARSAREAVVLDRASTAFLLGEAHAAYRTRINDILLAAAAQTLCEWAQRDRILIEVEAHGREELPGTSGDAPDLSRTVGWFTALCPVQLTVSDSAPAILLTQTKEQLRQWPGQGLGYGLWCSQSGQAGVQPQVSFNYLGRFDALPEASGWQMLPRTAALADLERDPASLRRCLLDLTAMVANGQLHLECLYCSALHQQPEIAAFLQQYLQNLRALLAHCAEVRGLATPSDFPLARLQQSQLDTLMHSLPAERVADLYPLSPMQAGLLFHAMLAPQGGAYLNQLQVRLHRLEVARFRQAWQTVLERHDILRSGFLVHSDQPLQWVAQHAMLAIDEYDWRQRPDLDSALQALAATEHARGVDLQHPPLMRLSLVRVTDQVHHLIWTRHHLLLDGWSTQQLIGEVLRLYRGAVLPTPTLRYRDYIAWLQQQDRSSAEQFWRAQLAGIEGPTSLVNALPPLQQPGRGQGSCHATLDLLATARLQSFAREHQCTLNTLVQAAWSLVLARYCGQSTVVFGATVAGRPSELEGAEDLLGLFINTVPIVIRLQPEMTVQTLLQTLQASNLAVREFDGTPLYDIQAWAGRAGQSLFDSILVFENYPLDLALQAEQQQGLRLEVLHNREETHYPLTLIATLTERLQLEWRYDAALIAPASAQALRQLTESLLLQLAGHLHRPLAELACQSPAEQAAMLALSRNPQVHEAGNVLALIEAQVQAHPKRAALRVPHTGQTL
ncbi:non-ribosomal peptide synthetase, partial [Herbaspirillum sp. SJZ099]|uniref:non-ribosomal peptide synthetase n=1 Tax=Herbaspirillum sp. SJZ099 TaxID=2572916 RepID=UPI0011A428F2